MEKELNIAAILKEKPNVKLWSPMLGDCKLKEIDPNGTLTVEDSRTAQYYFDYKGRFDGTMGEIILFPSKQMRDWSKFAWKKGDVLVYIDGEEPYYAIFESFEDDEYTAFKSRYNYSGGNHWLQFNCQSSTNHFAKASDDEAKEFIKKVEEHYGGKLNLSTLQIEQPKPEFKDGDIVHLNHCAGTLEAVFIFKSMDNYKIYDHASLMIKDNVLYADSIRPCADADVLRELRPATDSEKQQLFEALAKKGKAWNPDTLQIEDLPKKCEFEPFQKVLVRCKDYQKWKVDFFSHYDDSCKGFPYVCVSSRKSYCIPYNDSTKHLLGTTDEWKGGEG